MLTTICYLLIVGLLGVWLIDGVDHIKDRHPHWFGEVELTTNTV
ncbi:MAG: hypothetical protein JSC161_000941 [Candidatus Tokpelaia sp. JSC161]|jgi:uncharacterized membrane protein YuzA (DUF378 family)|nr:MAG: hypothetical protein JSC161_000941 [Candidatus Tokpelaia sp. JSC161]